MTVSTDLKLRTVWLSRAIDKNNIADALKVLLSLKGPSWSTADKGKIQCQALTIKGLAWVDLDTSDRYRFVTQCQRLGLDMAQPEVLELLDAYFGGDR